MRLCNIQRVITAVSRYNADEIIYKKILIISSKKNILPPLGIRDNVTGLFQRLKQSLK